MKKLLVVMAVMLLMMSTAAFADTTTFTVTGINPNPSGSPVPVSATVTLTAAGGVLTVSITNNISGSNTVAQNISGFFFTTNLSPVSVSDSGSGNTINFTTNPATTGSCTNCGNWALNSSYALGSLTGYQLSALNGSGPSQFPNYTIVGANPSGTGSFATGSHNPFFNQTATFSLAITGLNQLSQIGNFTLFFGTDNQTITPPTTTPEPASMFLLGTGLLGVGGAIRRKIRL